MAVDRRGHGGAEGILYVEVLIAMAILGFALLAITPMFVLAARENAASGDLTFAATLAQDKAEELRAAQFDTLVAGSWEEDIKQRSMRYRRTWVVEEDVPHPSMKRVTVTVTPQRPASLGSSQSRSATVRFYRVQ